MLIAGLTGGLGSGKSFVAEEFRRLGARVIEADEVGHQVLLPGEPAYEAVVRQFGEEILNSDRTLDRGKLAGLVFANQSALAILNAIVHPAVRERAARQFEAIADQAPDAVIIYVAAILIETGSAREFDRLILAACAREQQIERALARGKATEAEILARINAQLPLERKAEFADYIIDTGGTKEDTLRQTKMVYQALSKLALRKMK